jgi:TonB-linked SusC/RagA family outer membrane protein
MRKLIKESYRRSLLKKYFLILFTLSTCLLQAQITVNVQNQPLKAALKSIESSSSYRFFYNEGLKGVDNLVSVQLKDATIDQVMSKLLANTGITYRLESSNLIVLVASDASVKTAGKKRITGVVTDAAGDPIIGATIRVENTNHGTISNVNGQFEMGVPADGNLIVSFIGYTTKKIPITKSFVYNIILAEDAKELEEVVVVGYGTLRKSDLTGSVSQLKADKTEEKAYGSVEQMLQGTISGVQITQNTGALGGGITFSIRGVNSVNGDNQPLVVVDGYPVESGYSQIGIGAEGDAVNSESANNTLGSLNPNDIASIEILKDASATAIYGSRGANGVVLITTKRGKEGKDRIQYSLRTDFSQLPKKIDLLNTSEYIAFSNEAYLDKNDGSAIYGITQINDYLQTETNWQDLVFQTGVSQNHQLNFSGGDKKMKYALSLGYLKQNGIIINTQYDRGSIRLNLDREVNSRFNFGVNINSNMSINKAVNQSSYTGSLGGSIVSGALRTPPVYAAYTSESLINQIGLSNPLLLATKAEDIRRMTLIQGSAFANYYFAKNLYAKIRVGAYNNSGIRQYYMPRGTYYGDLRQGYAYEGNSRHFNYLAEYTLNYNQILKDKHSINAVVGYTWQNWIDRIGGIAVSGFPNDNFKYYNLGNATVVDKPQNRTQTWGLSSLLGRINYTFDKRYLFTITARSDGSTRLAEGYKWALFPSFALGWNVHNERFMRSIKQVSELKLRVSYGVSGNQSVAVGSTISKYDYGNAVINQTIVNTYWPQNMDNPLLRWESTEQYNVGTDIGLLANRVTLGANYYQKITSDLLINLPVPMSSGYTIYTTNSGEVENRGFEFDLRVALLTGELKWNVTGNFSFNRNKVLSFDGEMTEFAGRSFGAINNQNLHIAKVGYPIGSYYGYRIDGIYQTQEEINAGPVDPINPRPGSFKFVDISGPDGKSDGLISAFDREIIGNPYPDYIFGINNDINWRNFSLNILVQGVVGLDIINGNRYYSDSMNRGSGFNLRREAYYNRWTGPGTSNKYPGSRSTSLPFEGRFTDFLIEDGSFIRLKNITLSYTFSEWRIKPLSKLSLFITGTNLFTITSYSGFDPEVSAFGQNPMTPGVDFGSIPQFRTFSAGFSVGF